MVRQAHHERPLVLSLAKDHHERPLVLSLAKDNHERLANLDSNACKYKVRKSWLGRYLALGQNLDGRYLAVVFESKGSGKIRPVAARKMEDWEKRLFRRK